MNKPTWRECAAQGMKQDETALAMRPKPVRGSPYTPDEIKRIQEMHEAGASFAAIARDTGRNETGVAKAVRRKVSVYMTETDRARAIELFQAGRTTPSIASELDFSARAIQRVVRGTRSNVGSKPAPKKAPPVKRTVVEFVDGGRLSVSHGESEAHAAAMVACMIEGRAIAREYFEGGE